MNIERAISEALRAVRVAKVTGAQDLTNIFLKMLDDERMPATFNHEQVRMFITAANSAYAEEIRSGR